jgi:hypothetical protein
MKLHLASFYEDPQSQFAISPCVFDIGASK